MAEEKVSVIVPVYNVEKYLRRCLDSIINQTYQNLEIILVDDGSPDNCGAICDEYATKDCRFRVIHQKNGGVSAARNVAMQESKGEYIIFVDSDDYLGKDYVDHLMRSDADYVATGCFAQERDLNWKKWSNHAVKMTISDIVREPELINSVPMGMVWSKRYRTGLLQKYGINFNVAISRGEDTLFNAEYLNACETIEVIDYCDYYYRFGGLATTSFNASLYKWSRLSVLKVGEIIGKNNEVFYTRAWNNAMLVCENYFLFETKITLKRRLQVMCCLFEICSDKYVRKGMKYAKNNGQKRMVQYIRWYLLPLRPMFR